MSNSSEEKKVSIIMASYNHSKFIREAIDSILCQTYDNWELIIVDDGSIDNSRTIIREYESHNKKIKFYTHENNKNLGICETYKLAFEKTDGEYVAFLESDDILEKESIYHKVKILDKYKEVVLVYTDVIQFGEEKFINQRRHHLKSYSPIEKEIPFNALKNLIINNFVPSFSTVMIRKTKDIVYPQKQFNPWFDWWLWTQLSVLGKFYCIPMKLTKWRSYTDSYMSQFMLSIKNIEEYYNSFKIDLEMLVKSKMNINPSNKTEAKLFCEFLELCNSYRYIQEKLNSNYKTFSC